MMRRATQKIPKVTKFVTMEMEKKVASSTSGDSDLCRRSSPSLEVIEKSQA